MFASRVDGGGVNGVIDAEYDEFIIMFLVSRESKFDEAPDKNTIYEGKKLTRLATKVVIRGLCLVKKI